MHIRVDKDPDIRHLTLKRNNYFPNSTLPVLLYKQVLDLPLQINKAAEIIRDIFTHHRWSNTWKDGIYDYHHYHSNAHECMGIANRAAMVILGGPGGKKITLSRGDVLILPAGIGHKCISATKNFVCVGAYPNGKEFNINTGSLEEYKKAMLQLRKLPVPSYDPVFGKENILKEYWI